MKKAIKIFAVVLLVLVGAVVALPFVFKDKIFDIARKESRKSLNAEVDFKGLDLSIFKSFPDFTLSLHEFSVVGVEDFDGDTLAYIPNLEFTIDIMSVISGEEIQVKSFFLEKPFFQAIVLQDGRANWDIMKPSEEVEAIEAEEKAAGEPTTYKASLKEYGINEARIIYDDRASKMYAEILNLTHTGNGDFTQDIFDLRTVTDIEKLTYVDGSMKYLNQAKINFVMDLEMNMPEMKFTFKENELALNELFLGMDGWVAMPEDDIDMDITFFAKKTEFRNILSLVPAVYMTDFESLKSSGSLALNGFAKGVYNDEKMPAFELKMLVENGQFAYPDLPSDVKNVNLNMLISNADGNLDNTVIDIKRFYMEMAENPIEANLKVTNPIIDPNMKGMIKGKLVLDNVKDLIPMEEGESVSGTIIADINLAGKYSSIENEKYEEFKFDGEFIATDILYQSPDFSYDIKINSAYMGFSPQMVELTQFDAVMGKSDMKMKGKIDNILGYVFANEILKGSFKFDADFIDAYELAGMDEESESTTTETSETTTETTTLEIFEVPDYLDFRLESNIKKLLYDDVEIDNMTGVITIAKSEMKFSNINMEMLEGRMNMSGYYNTVHPKDPVFDFNMSINNFDIQKTATTFNSVEKMAPIIKSAYGKYSVGFKVHGHLDQKMEPVYESLTGNGAFNTNEVMIKGFAVTDKIADLLKMPHLKELVMKDVRFDFIFQDGRVDVAPFDFNVRDSKVTVSGSNYFDQRIDYVWNFEVPSKEFGGAVNQIFSGVASQASALGFDLPSADVIKVDMFIKGTATEPQIKMGVPSLGGEKGSMKDELKDKAKEELERRKKELEDKAREETERLRREAEEKAQAEIDKAKAKAEAEAERLKKQAEAEAEKLRKEAEEKAKKEAERLKEEGKDRVRGLLGR